MSNNKTLGVSTFNYLDEKEIIPLPKTSLNLHVLQESMFLHQILNNQLDPEIHSICHGQLASEIYPH